MADLLERSDRQMALHRRDVGTAFQYVWSRIIAFQGDPRLDPDIELVFSAAELLASRQTLEATPFVAAWDRGVATTDVKRQYPDRDPIGTAVAKLVEEEIKGRTFGRRAVDDAVRETIREETGLGGGGDAFQELLDAMLRALRELTKITSVDRFSYLGPLFDLAEAQGSLTVATLNYDRSLEALGAERGATVHTGIEAWTETGGWSREGSGVHLLKLHGSVDWWLVGPTLTPGNLPANELQVAETPPSNAIPCVLFGQRTKLRADGPFLDLLREFAAALDEVSRLVVVGYSFRDDHVNEYLRRWVNGNADRKLIVIDDGFPVPPPYYVPYAELGFAVQLQQFLLPPRPPHPASATFEPRLEIHGRKASEALADVLRASST